MTGVPISIMVLVFSAPELVGEHLDGLAGVSMLLQSGACDAACEHAGERPGRVACPARPKRQREPIIAEKDPVRWPSRSSKPRGLASAE